MVMKKGLIKTHTHTQIEKLLFILLNTLPKILYVQPTHNAEVMLTFYQYNIGYYSTLYFQGVEDILWHEN